MNPAASSSPEEMYGADITPGKTIAGTDDSSRVEHFNHFVAAGVRSNREAPLPELRAIWERNRLDIVCDGASPESGLLEYARMWCSMSEMELVETLRLRGLDDRGEKWHLVEVLIRDEYVHTV